MADIKEIILFLEKRQDFLQKELLQASLQEDLTACNIIFIQKTEVGNLLNFIRMLYQGDFV